MENVNSKEKRIEVVELTIGELIEKMDNPRRITAKKIAELRESIEQFGDFGVIDIDENNDILSGHQRVSAMRALYGDNHKVLCKRLMGYTQQEKMAINLKANTHAGEWDLAKLADWTSKLTVKVGLELPNIDNNDVKVRDMELIRFEKYNYLMLVCDNEVDYNNLIQTYGCLCASP